MSKPRIGLNCNLMDMHDPLKAKAICHLKYIDAGDGIDVLKVADRLGLQGIVHVHQVAVQPDARFAHAKIPLTHSAFSAYSARNTLLNCLGFGILFMESSEISVHSLFCSAPSGLSGSIAGFSVSLATLPANKKKISRKNAIIAAPMSAPILT